MPRLIRILLVEDNIGDSTILRELFKESGTPIEVSLAPDGVEATNYLNRVGEGNGTPRPDVILLDLNLPRKDGRQLLKEIRENPDLKFIPVCVLTTSDRQEDREKCYELKANSFLTKPKDLGGFEELVSRLLSVEFPRLNVGGTAEASHGHF